MAEFTYSIDIEPQYRDLDPNGHVNQAVYASYFEQARTKYWHDVIGIRHDTAEVALVRQEIEYRHPITLADTVTIDMAIPRLGESSIPMEYQARIADTVAATASVVLLAYDRENHEARSLPAAWREPIEAREPLEDPS